MRPLSSKLTHSAILSSLLLGFSDAQACPGICTNAGEVLLNPSKPIFLDSGVQFCATLNDVSRQITDDPGACQDGAVQAASFGCECGVPPTPTTPTVAPVVPGMPVSTPSGEEPCLGVCLGGTLLSPNKIVTIPGRNPDFCFVIDNQLKDIVGNPNQCDTLSVGARESGCECEGIPTESPTMKPSLRPTGTPTGSPAPTKTAYPTKVPTTPNPTGTPTTPNPTTSPAPCAGVCLDPSETVADPNFIIITPNAVGAGIITESCAEADARYKQIFAPAATCERFSRTALNAGCSCTSAVDCNGICNSPQVTPKSGIQITTPNLIVEIDGRPDTCANWDAQWDATTSPLICEDVPSKVSQALAAGCRCDVPVDCDGLCPGESVTTPFLEVELSNGFVATCSQLDAEFDVTIDPGLCSEYDSYRTEAFDKGCRCGTPIACEGLCPNEADVLLTPNLIVDLPDGNSASCASVDVEVRQFIDAGLCSAAINEALAGGCRCGEPIKCEGICPNKERKLFDKNTKIIVPWTGKEQKCGDVDKQIKDLIDEITCLERRDESIQAGCQCGDTTESPSMMPSISAAPTVVDSAAPTGVPTGSPPTVAPNVPFQPPVGDGDGNGGAPSTNGGSSSGNGGGPSSGDGGGASQAGSGSFKKQVLLTMMSTMVTVYVALAL